MLVSKRCTAKGCAGAVRHSAVSTTINIYAHVTREDKRCNETAETIYKKNGIIKIPDFAELDFGDFEGKAEMLSVIILI